MVVGFTTTYAISAYHHWCCEFKSRSWQGVQLCDKVCQWLETGRWCCPVPPVSSINNTDRQDIAEILLKVVLNTIKQTNYCNVRCFEIVSLKMYTRQLEIKQSYNFIYYTCEPSGGSIFLPILRVPPVNSKSSAREKNQVQ